MYHQRSLLDSVESICLQASEGGNTPCDSPDGRTSCPSGPGVAHASLFQSRDEDSEQTTTGTSGRKCSGSSASAALQSSLESKLRARLDCDGSMEYSQTLKVRATPAGRRLLVHTASARRTSGNGCTGWPTTSCRDWKDTPGMSQTGVNPDGSARSRLDQLPRVATLAGTAATDGTIAAMGNTAGFRLNPRFSLWLMGYPDEWASCGALAMPLSRKSPRNS